jgi:EpsI family protein
MSLLRLAAAVAMVVGTAVIAAKAREPIAVSPPALDVPYEIGSWEGVDTAVDDETARATAADLLVSRRYVAADGGAADLYIAYYSQQRPGVSIHSPLHCLPGTGWDVVSNATITVPMPGQTTGRVRRLIAQKAAARVMVLYWYGIHGRMIASDLASRLQLLGDRVRFGRNDAALVRVAVPVAGSDAAAEQRGLGFTRALVPYLTHEMN